MFNKNGAWDTTLNGDLIHYTADVKECSSEPCANGATCHEGINDYTCQCDGGYTGLHCETGRFQFFQFQFFQYVMQIT